VQSGEIARVTSERVAVAVREDEGVLSRITTTDIETSNGVVH
jgi:hypothetical protein